MAAPLMPEKTVKNPYSDSNPPTALEWDTTSVTEHGLHMVKEEGDALIPGEGFIKDYVYWTKGIEAPTEFAIWTALWLLSSFAKRDVYFKWLKDMPLYPNLYVILVAPPSISRKSTILSRSQFLSYLAPMTLMHDPWVASKKMLTTHRGKITPEGLHELLMPEEEYLAAHRNGDGKMHQKPVFRGSQVSLIVSELTTMLSRSTYNTGLVDKLTDLYDCKAIDDSYTKKDGPQVLRDIYVTFLGATTPDGMRLSMPQEAFGGGFMSRVIVVYSEQLTRFYHRPFEPPGAPTTAEMSKRLGWVVEGMVGKDGTSLEYDLSPEADELHRDWYLQYRQGLLDQSEAQMHIRARMDHILLKLALLVRLQRYQRGTTIEVEDYLAAKRILMATLSESSEVYEDASSSEQREGFVRVRKLLYRSGTRTWQQMRTNLTRYLTADEVADILQDLIDSGMVEVHYEGKVYNHPMRKTQALYKWVGPRRGVVSNG